MNSEYKLRNSGMGVSVGQMRKELIKHGIEIDKEIDLTQAYNQLMAEKGFPQSENQSNRFSTPSDQNNKSQKTGLFGQRSNIEAFNSEQGKLTPNLPPPMENNKTKFQTFMNIIDQSKEKKNNQNIVLSEQGNSDMTQGQSSNNIPSRNEGQNNQVEEIPEQAESNQSSSARQSRFQLFNFGQQGQSAKNSLQNNRTSSASISNSRLSGGISGINGQTQQQQNQSQRNSSDVNNRLSHEIQQNSPGNIHNQYFKMSSPNVNYGIRSSSNSMLNQQQGYIANDNSSRRVSNQSYMNNHQQDSYIRKQQQGSPFSHPINQNSIWKSGGDSKRSFPQHATPSGGFEGSGIQYRQSYTPNYQSFQRTMSYTEQKGNQSLIDTAKALSQSQKKQTKQSDSLFNLTQFALFGERNPQIESRRSVNMMSNLVDESMYFNSNQSQRLKFKDRLKILYSRIETSHVVMFLMVSLFLIFFLQNIYDYLTFKPEKQFCDSTLRLEQVESSQCLPCPLNAICLNNNVKCIQSFVLVDKKCIPNPQIEPNTIRYINTVIQNLQFIQAQYHCSDPNSSGYGNNISRPYKEHKWDSIVSIITTHHGKDLLFYDTLSKVQDYLRSKSIREQFDISYDSSRDTYYVTTFHPSYFCRIKLYILQNSFMLITAVSLFVLIFLLCQVPNVKRFIYFFKLYSTHQKANQSNQIYQNQQQPINPQNPGQLNNSFMKEQQSFQSAGQMNQRYIPPQQQQQLYEQNYQQQQQQQYLQIPQQQQQQVYLQTPQQQQQQYLSVPQQQFLKLDNSFSNQSFRRNRQS